MPEENTGWICPNCKKVHSPDVKSCTCTKTESTTEDTRKLLLE